MQEHDVEIGTWTEFESAEFAEADDRERRRRRLDRFGRSLPRELQRFLQDHLGEERQIVGDVHQRQDAAHLACCDAKLMRLFERAQHLEFGLFAAALDRVESRAQFRAQRIDVRESCTAAPDRAARRATSDGGSARRRASGWRRRSRPASATPPDFPAAARSRQSGARVASSNGTSRASVRSGRARGLRLTEQFRYQRVEARATLAADPRPVARGTQPVDQRRHVVASRRNRPPPARRPTPAHHLRATAGCHVVDRVGSARRPGSPTRTRARRSRAAPRARVQTAQNRRNPCRAATRA